MRAHELCGLRKSEARYREAEQMAVEGHTERRTLIGILSGRLRAGSALLVRGSSRRITIMRF